MWIKSIIPTIKIFLMFNFLNRLMSLLQASAASSENCLIGCRKSSITWPPYTSILWTNKGMQYRGCRLTYSSALWKTKSLKNCRSIPLLLASIFKIWMNFRIKILFTSVIIAVWSGSVENLCSVTMIRCSWSLPYFMHDQTHIFSEFFMNSLFSNFLYFIMFISHCTS